MPNNLKGRERHSPNDVAAQLVTRENHHHSNSIRSEHKSPLARSQEALNAAFAKHDRRLDRKKRKRCFAPIGSVLSCQRLRNVERYLSWRYGCILPEGDDGRRTTCRSCSPAPRRLASPP